jgi:hypothetical protein
MDANEGASLYVSNANLLIPNKVLESAGMVFLTSLLTTRSYSGVE